MTLKIAILEDNVERVSAMRYRMTERFPQYELGFFSSAHSMIDWLSENLESTIVISLDHDLEPQPDSNGRACDAGTGKCVTEFLLTQTPVCPVIVHSSNYYAATSMESELQDAGWPTVRVAPHEDLAWIGVEWFIAMRNAIVNAPLGIPATEKISSPN